MQSRGTNKDNKYGALMKNVKKQYLKRVKETDIPLTEVPSFLLPLAVNIIIQSRAV